RAPYDYFVQSAKTAARPIARCCSRKPSPSRTSFLRASLRNFGLKVGVIGTMKFEARIRELVERLPDLAVLVEPLLIVRRVIREQLGILHRRLLAIVRDDDVCRRLTTIPGVGQRCNLDNREGSHPGTFCLVSSRLRAVPLEFVRAEKLPVTNRLR